MPFPNLTLRVDTRRPEGVAMLWAEATGVPDNGVNAVALPFVAAGVDADDIEEESLEVTLEYPNFPSTVIGMRVPAGSLAVNKQSLNITFDQTGGDSVRVIVQVKHTHVG